MSYRVHWSQLRIGLVVSLVVIAASSLVFFIDDVRDSLEDRYTLHFHTVTTQALRPRAPVWLAGQPVGLIGGLEFRPPRDGEPAHLVVELHISSDAQPFITEGAVAQVTSAGLLGVALVNILPSAEDTEPLRDGDQLPSATVLDPSELTSRSKALYDSVLPVAERWRQVLDRLENGDGTLARMRSRPGELDELLDNLSQLNATFSSLGAVAGGFADVLADEEVQAALGRIGPRLESLAVRWDERSGSVGRFAEDTSLAPRLERIRANIGRLSERVGSGRGTIPRFLNDRALVDELARTREMLEALRADFAGTASGPGQP
jgi:phospholipid/cholesterol/gamma-HCH transport system substrate-binding protein